MHRTVLGTGSGLWPIMLMLVCSYKPLHTLLMPKNVCLLMFHLLLMSSLTVQSWDMSRLLVLEVILLTRESRSFHINVTYKPWKGIQSSLCHSPIPLAFNKLQNVHIFFISAWEKDFVLDPRLAVHCEHRRAQRGVYNWLSWGSVRDPCVRVCATQRAGVTTTLLFPVRVQTDPDMFQLA